MPFAIGVNWVLNKLGAGKINLSPEAPQKRLGIFGEPISLGLILGLLLGLLGNLKNLGTLAAWGQIATVGIATSAIMVIFPKVSSIFAQAFLPLTETAKKNLKKSNSKSGDKTREWYLGVNDAMGYGETATLTSGILLIPIMVILALILPGNQALPLVDLIALPFMIQATVAITNGNIFKSVIIGAIWFSLVLYAATYTAPIFTEVAKGVGVTIPAETLLITSFGILTSPVTALIFLAFLSQSWIWIGLVLAIYAVSYFLFKRNKETIVNYLETSATAADGTAQASTPDKQVG
ncbi:PTS transporter subunit IIC [Brevibacillus fluminis]|uniref:PTS transporter subunit IIC n=1 Tax=Brevibacillus fluminis TaxID=511487 RepID=UPI002482C0EC|nr:PTS transporter subunit IIC [Brevibacillus fluminis]